MGGCGVGVGVRWGWGGWDGATHWFKQDHCKAYVNLYKAKLDGIVEPKTYIIQGKASTNLTHVKTTSHWVK